MTELDCTRPAHCTEQLYKPEDVLPHSRSYPPGNFVSVPAPTFYPLQTESVSLDWMNKDSIPKQWHSVLSILRKPVPAAHRQMPFSADRYDNAVPSLFQERQEPVPRFHRLRSVACARYPPDRLPPTGNPPVYPNGRKHR